MKNGGFFNSKLLNYQRLFLFYPTLTGCSAPHFMEPPIEKSLRMASPAVTIYDRATGTRRSRSTTHPTPHHLNVLRCRVTAEWWTKKNTARKSSEGVFCKSGVRKNYQKMYDECMRPSICLSVRLSIRLSLSVSTNCVYRSVCWSSLKYSSWMVLRAYHRYHPNKTVWSHSPPSNTTKPVWKSLSNPIKTP